MDIEITEGTSARLYELVAPLVMNAAILRLNNNYPFKTSRHYRWYIAIEKGEVIGFIPVKEKEREACIDNYYICGDESFLIDALLERVVADWACRTTLTAVVHKRHVDDFVRNGFKIHREWKIYDRMMYEKGGHKE
ncbi:MAG: hypothetical protein NC206_11045 [Bacteroides sp.]|nr:hypothetical protein [Roseburia sp.]MCM1347605.1 hypothetical protein [Bacteroides sp.]MCM1422049.1 hypothetical protein [Bacteroides sp.]